MRPRWVGRAAFPFLAVFLGGFQGFSFPDIQSRPSVTSSPSPAPSPSPAAGGGREFSVLIGILTVPDKYEMRHFLRLVYAAQATPLADIDIKFVLCGLATEEQKLMVALEILRFDDIIILDCAETMDGGETDTFLSSLPRILPRRYDYVMTADDDTFVRLGPLARSLRWLPREGLYQGYVAPCSGENPFSGHTSGTGCLMSWDLVEWISSSEIPRDTAIGTEDKLVAARYDFSADGYGGCSHPLTPETVAVLRLKTRERWVEMLSFFNLTKPLKPSKLYHID